MGVIDFAAVMLQSIGNDKIFSLKHHIVSANLVEDCLCDFDRRSLVFHNHPRPAVFRVIEHTVTAPGHATHAYGDFVGQQGGGVVLVVHQKVREVLAYPFLGGEPYVSAAQKVVYVRLAVALLRAQCARG